MRTFIIVGNNSSKEKNIKKLLSKHKKDSYIFKKKDGIISNFFPILYDYKDSAGSVKGHYFHQDLRVSSLIYKSRVKKHLDVGGRIDGFISSISIFTHVDVLDIRDLKINKKNIKFINGDFMDKNFYENNKYQSISCLHTIEHLGLGRYGDQINPKGHLIGFYNLYKILDKNGNLYISFPVSNNPRVEFNAHRIFEPKEILNWIIDLKIFDLKLVSFDLIDDNSNLIENCDIQAINNNLDFGCGIYHFKKTID